MRRLEKIILAVASGMLIVAVVIGLPIHFARNAKNEISSTESLSNTTIISSINTNSSTMISAMIDSTASAKNNTTTRNRPSTIIDASTTATENATNTVKISIITNPLTSTSNVATLLGITNVTSVNSIRSTSEVTLGTAAASNASITSFPSASTTSTVTTDIVSGSMMSSTHANVSTTVTTAMASTSTGLNCLFGFEPIVSYVTDDYLGVNAVALGDFNNDSFLDIVVANNENSSVGILLGNGDGTFLPEKTFFTGRNTYPDSIAVGDLNNDRRLDVVITSGETSNIIVLFGNGDGTLLVQRTISTGTDSYPYGVTVGYFNDDNILDVTVANSGTNRVGVFIGNGNGTFQTQKLLQTGSRSYPYGLAIGDFNHDNYTDIAAINSGTSSVGVFLGYGNGSFQSQMTFSAGNDSFWMNAADFNGDDHLDFAVLNSGSNNIGILMGYGNGTFSAQTTYTVENLSQTYIFSVADVNNDGHWDILIPNTINSNVGILLGRGDGSFGMQMTFSTGTDSSPGGVVAGDFNRDKRPDIVTVSIKTDEIGVLLRKC